MKLALDEIFSSRPNVLGRELIKRGGFKGPFIDEREIAEFLGYEVVEVFPEEYPQFPGLSEIFAVASAHLFPNERLILVNKSMPQVNKRLGVFHEAGHETIPTHHASALFCSSRDLEPSVHKRVEREAFLCGAELLFPLQHFVEDATSLDLGINAIERLAKRYRASQEATAIRYGHTNQNVMAIVMVQPSESYISDSRIIELTYRQTELSLLIPNIRKRYGIPPAPLKVQYFIRSPRFQKFIRPGTEIREGNIIYDAWREGTKKIGEIPASVFMSSEKFSYIAECKPIGDDGRVMVLLWLPNKQPEFWSGIL